LTNIVPLNGGAITLSGFFILIELMVNK